MSKQKYESYFLMKIDDVAAYVQAKLLFFPKDADFECKEIGDGNLNYVFKVKDKNTGKSIIIKQAGTSLRIDKNMHLPVDRGKIESRILGIQKEYTKSLVPEVYLYDQIMCAMLMEDMVNHTMMRTGLTHHKTYPKFADDISTFLVNSLLLSSDIVKDHKVKKLLVKEFINPDLCEISEDLVFTEPYNDCNNIVSDSALGPITYEYNVKTCVDLACDVNFYDSYSVEAKVSPCQNLPRWEEGR
jgi:5-methylthioribose kinase